MALKSMTGHGYAEASSRGIQVQAEISSVNRKQLDVQVSLPRSLASLESRLLETIRNAVTRGQVYATFTVNVSETTRQRGVRIDAELAGAYVRRVRAAARRLGLADDLTARTLVHLPEVVRYEYAEQDANAIWPILRRAAAGALRRMILMRAREGRATEADLAARFRNLETGFLRRIRERAPGVVGKYAAALRERLRRAGFVTESHDPQVLKELAIFADRSDISEEITRLDSHLKQGMELLRSREAVGRTLDFLAQEMFREINTIGSKANDATISREVIQFKTELERVREQVQNIE